jgi:hypothetical protein
LVRFDTDKHHLASLVYIFYNSFTFHAA